MMSIIQQNRQKGAVLVVSLIVLILLTLIGFGAIKPTILQERMAGNTYDYNLAYEAAESAIRSAENWLEALTAKPIATGTTPNQSQKQIWQTNAGITNTSSMWWQQVNSAWWSTNAVQYSGTLGNITTEPYYVIEFFRESKDSLDLGLQTDIASSYVYRITAKGTGRNDDSKVLLQTYSTVRF